jgi:glutathione S-transferase
MVQLADSDIKTREVLDWTGVHLFHGTGSSCSQKTRIFLNLKGIEWESHVIDMATQENFGDWYLGINPRGLVPCLVIDGQVHIESNDIMTLLDERFPEPKLIPEGRESEMAELLHHEDDLHLDLRTLTFRFIHKVEGPAKDPAAVDNYRVAGSGTVQGSKDPERERQVAFWDRVADIGITDEAAQISANRFRAAFDGLSDRLGDNAYLLGANITVLDIAWFVYANRLVLAGYPLERLHPSIWRWFEPLRARPEFAEQIARPQGFFDDVAAFQAEQAAANATLSNVAGF